MSEATAQRLRAAIAHEQKRAAELNDLAWRVTFDLQPRWGFHPWRLYAGITERLGFWRKLA